MKNDSTVQFFNTKTYKVTGDTLRGNGQKVIQGEKQKPENLEISLNDILQVKYENIHQLMKRRPENEKILNSTASNVYYLFMCKIKKLRVFPNTWFKKQV